MPTPLSELPIIESLIDLGPRAGWVLGVELLRGLAVLLVVAVAIRAAGGVRARYRIVGAGILLALLLPLAGVTPGGWRVGVPGEWVSGQNQTAHETATDEVVSAASHHASHPRTENDPAMATTWSGSPSTLTDTLAVRTAGPIETAITPSTAAPPSGFEIMGWSLSDARALGDSAMSKIEFAAGEPITWVGLWALGAFIVLAWGLIGVIKLAVIARAATPADDRWTLEATRVTNRLGIRRPVRVVVSDRVPVPMTWGVLRPIVVVPAMATAWDAERRRVVLTHELVHVRRLDWALQIAAWFVAAAHWCNPLAWWAVRRLAVERERSCDAEVIASGTRPSAYASHLLDIARAMSDVRSPVHALGMAKASELEGRLMSILNGTRRGAKRSVAAAMLVMCAGLAAAAVAPEIIPPEKQAELDRYEAELAELEARLAAKRARLIEAREAAEAEEREEAGAEPDARVEAEARAQYEQLVDRETAHARHAERAARAEYAELAERRVVLGRDAEAAREIASQFRERQPEALAKWRVLAKDKAALTERLSHHALRLEPKIIELHRQMGDLGVELDLRGEKLDLIAQKLAPFREQLELREIELEPYREHLTELQHTLETEMATIQDKIQMTVQSPEVQLHLERLADQENQIRDQVEAMAARIAEAAKAGDYERVVEIGQLMSELALRRDEAVVDLSVAATDAHDRVAHIRDQMADQQHKIAARIHEKMNEVHESMNDVRSGMNESHEHMNSVHEEMNGVHEEMNEVHQRLDQVHQKIESMIREILKEIVGEALREHGLHKDREQAEKISAAASHADGEWMMFSTDDDKELVRVHDKAEHFKHMREAVAKAEAAGDLKLSVKALDRLDAALKAAAAEGEVLRFRLHDDTEGGDGEI